MTEKIGATSTTDDVLAGLDLNGKRVLVTGTSSALGLETAQAFVAHEAHVVGTVRDLNKAMQQPEQSAPPQPRAAIST